MPLTSRKKRPVSRPEATRDAKLFVVATEGEHTERIYFNAFGNSRLKIVSIPCEEGKSSPEYVCSNLVTFQDRFELLPGDELWMVIDRDRWPRAKLHKIRLICSEASFNVAVSNPCFEIWLSYHFERIPAGVVTAKSLIKHLRTHGFVYKKGDYDPSLLLSRVKTAIKQAAEDDKDPRSPWPMPRGSRVYQLVKKLLKYHPELS